ncbi:MAG: response regulator transcription factor [Chloroflexi bacterium]|nr:response regulator transcription factor [Chloroflexota bacterium]
MRLLIIEDERDLANALAKGLRREGYNIDLACDGEEGLHMGQVNDYDMLILDLNLPRMDGMEVCRRMRAMYPAILILMLTARDAPEDRVAGLDTGADDYLIKPFHFSELTARIRALFRRDSRAHELILACGDIKLDPASHVAWLNNRRLELTRKEFGILEYLMRHAGEVVSQEALLEHVWDERANLFTNTVRVHINGLRHKLGDDPDTPCYIETIIGVGYRMKAG